LRLAAKSLLKFFTKSEEDFRFKFVDWLEVKAELELELAIQPNFLITLREVLPNLW
jgi:hypothetical protein